MVSDKKIFKFFYTENLKIFLSETTGPILYTFAEMFLWWSSTKIVQAIVVSDKKIF